LHHVSTLERLLEEHRRSPGDPGHLSRLALEVARLEHLPPQLTADELMPAVLRTLHRNPHERSLAELATALLGIEPLPFPPDERGLWWSEERCALPVGAAPYDLVTGLPLRARHRRTGLELAWIPSGSLRRSCHASRAQQETLIMRATNEHLERRPRERSTAPEDVAGFYIGRYPVRVRDFAAYLEDGGVPPESWEEQERHPECPVVFVDFLAVRRYLAWAELRLPAEREWQLAAEGPAGQLRHWGGAEPEEDAPGLVCVREWPDADRLVRPLPVTTHPERPGPTGARQMCGNVWEWCSTRYQGRMFPEDGQNLLVIKGGSFRTGEYDITTGAFQVSEHDRSWDDLGFRVALSVATGDEALELVPRSPAPRILSRAPDERGTHGSRRPGPPPPPPGATRLVAPTRRHQGEVLALAFAGPDRLVSAGADGTVRIWALSSGEERWRYAAGAPAELYATVAAEVPRLALSTEDGDVLVLHFGTRAEERRFTGFRTPPAALGLSRDGRLLGVLTRGGEVHLLDAEDGARLQSWTLEALPQESDPDRPPGWEQRRSIYIGFEARHSWVHVTPEGRLLVRLSRRVVELRQGRRPRGWPGAVLDQGFREGRRWLVGAQASPGGRWLVLLETQSKGTYSSSRTSWRTVVDLENDGDETVRKLWAGNNAILGVTDEGKALHKGNTPLPVSIRRAFGGDVPSVDRPLAYDPERDRVAFSTDGGGILVLDRRAEDPSRATVFSSVPLDRQVVLAAVSGSQVIGGGRHGLIVFQRAEGHAAGWVARARPVPGAQGEVFRLAPRADGRAVAFREMGDTLGDAVHRPGVRVLAEDGSLLGPITWERPPDEHARDPHLEDQALDGGGALLLAWSNGLVQRLDPRDPATRTSLHQREGTISGGRFSRDGGRVAWLVSIERGDRPASEEHSYLLEVHDLQADTLMAQHRIPGGTHPSLLGFSGDSRQVLWSRWPGSDRFLHWLCVETIRSGEALLPAEFLPDPVAIAPDGSKVYGATPAGDLLEFEHGAGNTRVVGRTGAWVSALAMDPRGTHLYSADFHGEVLAWNL
jgi:formylglycine-generating enzyme required for sulfatase activity